MRQLKKVIREGREIYILCDNEQTAKDIEKNLKRMAKIPTFLVRKAVESKIK